MCGQPFLAASSSEILLPRVSFRRARVQPWASGEETQEDGVQKQRKGLLPSEEMLHSIETLLCDELPHLEIEQMNQTLRIT